MSLQEGKPTFRGHGRYLCHFRKANLHFVVTADICATSGRQTYISWSRPISVPLQEDKPTFRGHGRYLCHFRKANLHFVVTADICATSGRQTYISWSRPISVPLQEDKPTFSTLRFEITQSMHSLQDLSPVED